MVLKFLDADPGWKQFGSGMEKSRIRDKKIPDPQQWLQTNSLYNF
jgi:hypothetical protein